MDVAQTIVEKEQYGQTKHTIASHLTSLLQEKTLISHLQFLRGYGKVWFLPNFNWQKHVDSQTRMPGFLVVHQPIRFYVQTQEMENMSQSWKTKDEFKEFIEGYDEANNIYTKETLVTSFFNLAQNRHNKHFEQWRDKLYLTLAADELPATYLAKWLLNEDQVLIDPELNYFSEKHNRSINVKNIISFLTYGKHREEYNQLPWFLEHLSAIRTIAHGNTLWNENKGVGTSVCMQNFRTYVKNKWFIMPSNTQLVERYVKDANECTVTTKDPHFASLLAFLRSSTVFQFNSLAQATEEDRIIKGNQFLSTGRRGERIDKRTGETESKKEGTSNLPRGSTYSAFAIQCTLQRTKDLENMAPSRDDRAVIRDHLMKKNQQFVTLRDADTLLRFLQPAPSSAPRPNTIQRITGVEHTLQMLGEVKYSQVRTKHLDLLRGEFHARTGCHPDTKWKVRELTKNLKAYIVESQKKAIVQRTGCRIELIEDTHAELNLVSFKPMFRLQADYTAAVDN